MMGYFNTCVDPIRTIPSLQHDVNNVEDVSTSMEDHEADQGRYVCMSRPLVGQQKTAEVIDMDIWGRRKQVATSWKLM